METPRTPPKENGAQGLRRTERETAGVPPKRLGFEDMTVFKTQPAVKVPVTDKSDLERPEGVATPNPKKTSKKAKSTSSTKSVVLQKKEVEMEFRQRKTDIKRKKFNFEKNLKNTEKELGKLDRRLHTLLEEEGNSSQGVFKPELSKAKEDILNTKDELEVIADDLRNELELIEDELADLEVEKDVRNLQIEESAESSGSGTDDNVYDFTTPPPSVSQWLAGQQPIAASTPAAGPDMPPIQKADNSELLLERLVTVLESNAKNDPREVIIKSAVDKDLPKFDGNPKNWLSFCNAYKSTTEKYKFSKSENMSRMTKALQGDAYKAVEHYLSNPENLEKLWSTLEKRFGRPEFVLDHLVAKVREAKPPDISRPETIVEYGTVIESLVTNVESYHRKEYLENRLLVTELAEKLPSVLRSQWFEWIILNGKEASLLNFSKWLEVKVEAAILSVKPKPSRESTAKFEEKKQRPKRGPGAVHTTTVEQSEAKPQKTAHCPMCKKGHTLADCWTFAKLGVNERWKFIKETRPRICITCLKPGHGSLKCPTPAQCPQQGCLYKHHKLLHSPSPSATAATDRPCSPTRAAPHASTSHGSGGSISVTLVNGDAIVKGCDGPLPIVPVKLKGPRGIRSTYALLDSGASRTLITQELAKNVGLKGEPYPYSFTTIEGRSVKEPEAEIVDGEVGPDNSSEKYYPLRRAVTVAQMKMQPYSINIGRAIEKWPHLKRTRAKTLLNVVPEIIIGCNNPTLILAQDIICGPQGAPVGWRTPLGWTISGELDNPIETQKGSVNYFGGQPITNEYLHQIMKESFSSDNFGVVPLKRMGANLMEEKAFKILEETTKKKGDRWETGLLWKEDGIQLPQSYNMALSRLQCTERKMKDPEFAKLYREKIKEYEDKGYVRKLPSSDPDGDPREWFIPHFGVTNPNKPGKFRFVMDAAAKSHGVSLNDALMKGPDLNQSLVSVLWNFRLHRISLTGDIADMFHRVLVREEDRKAQRFLWRDGDKSRNPDIYEMSVLIFGATSSPTSAIYVKNTNAKLFEKQYPEATRAIIQDHYVDDCLTGADTVEKAQELRKQISDISDSGGFSVCKWMSSSPEVISSIPPNLRADGVKEVVEATDFPVERVLGLWLDHKGDSFTFKLNLHKVPEEILKGKRPTKRQVCSLIMSLYDPLGFIAHYKVKGLMILQRLWRAEVDWDDEIPSDIFEDWLKWLERLPDITNVRVPRCYDENLKGADSIELHVFVDASEEAYAACAYLRIKEGDRVSLGCVQFKARVAPLKKVTIPRMELLAALLGARLAKTIKSELRIKISRTVFWSDSRTVLAWIRSTATKYKEFVANRVGEIQEITDPLEWRWVPTDLNVADIATRYSSDISFLSDTTWYRGPEFLLEDECSWPTEQKQKEGAIAAVAGEVIPEEKAEDSSCEEKWKALSLPPVSRFSSFVRLLRATAAVEKAAKYWIWKTWKLRAEVGQPIWALQRTKKEAKRMSDKPKVAEGSSIDGIDMRQAEDKLVRAVQEECFGKEIEVLRGEEHLKASRLCALSPMLDEEGFLCVKGRIHSKFVPYRQSHPKILPSRHPFTELMIMKEHERAAHQGRETVLNAIRRKYWILDGRQTVLRVTRQCSKCHLRRVGPVVPEMGDIPSYRLAAYQPAFTFTGLDYMGPLEVTVGRHHEKRWVALFTCLVTRGVHLEVAHGLSTDEAILAITRFISTRGRPQIIYSDQGTNFVGAANEFGKGQAEVDFSKVMGHGPFLPIEWRFNPPAAPHFGGAWERLVGSVKKCLRVTLNQKYPHDTTLLTAIKEIEGILNSRPITHVSNDPTDPPALTPNHFLRGACDAGPAIPVSTDMDADLRAKWRRAQLLSEQFWRQWTRDYLPKLMTREKWRDKTEPIVIGDLVFIIDDNQPRNTWNRGYVSKIFPGPDNTVRVVEVTATTKENDVTKRRKVKYERPVAKICPIGLRMKIQED